MSSERMRLLRTHAEVRGRVLRSKLRGGWQRMDGEKWKERKEEVKEKERDKGGEYKRKERVRDGETLVDIEVSAMLERKTVPSRDLMWRLCILCTSMHTDLSLSSMHFFLLFNCQTFLINEWLSFIRLMETLTVPWEKKCRFRGFSTEKRIILWNMFAENPPRGFFRKQPSPSSPVFSRTFWIEIPRLPRPSCSLLLPLGVPRPCIFHGASWVFTKLWFSQTSWHLGSFISFTTITNGPLQSSITLALNYIASSGGYHELQHDMENRARLQAYGKREIEINWLRDQFSVQHITPVQ